MTASVTGTFSANGKSSSLRVLGSYGFFVWLGGNATFGGGTVTAEFYSALSAWEPLASLQATAIGEYQVQVPDDTLVRLSMDGATSPDLGYQISSMTAG